MPAQAFGRNKRLLTAADYKAVFAGAVFRVSNPCLLILAKPGVKSEARLGLVAAKKNLPTAVKRNRFKRIVREVFRRHQQNLSGLDTIVMARSGFSNLESVRQTELVSKGFNQLIRKTSKPSGKSDETVDS